MTKAHHPALILGAALFTLTACQDGTTGQSAGQAQAAPLTKVDVAFINRAGPAGLPGPQPADAAGPQLAAGGSR